MDDIERQLKAIQLQREHLALEKELARRKITASAMSAARGAGTSTLVGVRRVAEGIGRLLERWWKLAAFFALLAAVVYGGVKWVESVEQATREAKRAAYEAEFSKFAASKCADINRGIEFCNRGEAVSINDRFICMERRLEQSQCYDGARGAFIALQEAKKAQ